MIPKPLPFMRIGLANLPLILALDILPAPSFALLGAVKVLGQALITGTLFSYVFLFSLAGTALSAAGMYLIRRSLGGRIGFTGISVMGALLSNGVQITLARFFIFGVSAKYIAPPFLAAGIVTGMILGLFCEAFAARSAWYRRAHGESGEAPAARVKAADAIDPAEPVGPAEPDGPAALTGIRVNAAGTELTRTRVNSAGRFRAWDLCIAALLMAAAFLCNRSTVLRTAQLLIFWLFALLMGKKTRPVLALLIMTGIVFFNLLAPYGRVLAAFGPFRITQGSLLAGLRRAVTLEGLVMLSKAAVGPGLRLPGYFGALLGTSLRIFDKLSRRETRRFRRITPARFFEELDGLMLELGRDSPAGGQAPGAASAGTPVGTPAETSPVGTSAAALPGRLILAGAVLLTAALTLAPFADQLE
jgi:heptaprenyl diphosphate synthase